MNKPALTAVQYKFKQITLGHWFKYFVLVFTSFEEYSCTKVCISVALFVLYIIWFYTSFLLPKIVATFREHF